MNISDSKQIAADNIFLPSKRDDDLHKNHTLRLGFAHASLFDLQTSGGKGKRSRRKHRHLPRFLISKTHKLLDRLVDECSFKELILIGGFEVSGL